MTSYVSIKVKTTELFDLIIAYNDRLIESVRIENEERINRALAYHDKSPWEKFLFRILNNAPPKTREEIIASLKKERIWSFCSDYRHYRVLRDILPMVKHCMDTGIAEIEITEELYFLFGENK